MCCVPGGPARGDETEAIKRSIWDNQGRSQGFVQTQVDYVSSQKLASHGVMSVLYGQGAAERCTTTVW